MDNVQQLDANRTFRAEERRGAVREGNALLQGLVVCGRCGRRMGVRSMADGRRPLYVCGQLQRDFATKTCQELRGDAIDQAVAQLFLQAMQPAQLHLSLATLHQLEERARAVDRHWQLRLEWARYEVELTRWRYVAGAPENRLVARSLERDWNEKLTILDQLDRAYAARPAGDSLPVTDPERARIFALAKDLPLVWPAPTTTAAERKQLVRFLIKDVPLTKGQSTIRVEVRWETAAGSTLAVARPKPRGEVRRTVPAVLARIRELAPTLTDPQLAEHLTADGFRSGQGDRFSASKVHWLRYAYQLTSGCPQGPAACPPGQRGDGRASARAAAALLNVTVSTIADWCQTGKLDGVQTVPHGPRWVVLIPELLTTLRKPQPPHWSRRTSGDNAPGQKPFLS